MVTPSWGVIWPMTTTILACPGIGMNYSNIAVICRNTVVLRSMVSREGSKMALLHSCCIASLLPLLLRHSTSCHPLLRRPWLLFVLPIPTPPPPPPPPARPTPQQ
jgi:hypothetical protein